MSGGLPKIKSFKLRLGGKRCFLIFSIRGSERRGLVSVEVKKKKGQDIRRGMSGLRGASLFPHSIRSTSTDADADATANLRNKPASTEPPLATHKNKITKRTDHNNESMPKNFDSSEGGESKRIDMKVYRGSILPKEDQMTLNWLQNFDEKANETHLFDHRFDPNFHPYVTFPHQLVNL